MEVIDNVFRVYNKGNFKIKEIRAGPEFIKISDEVLDNMDIEFNPTPAQAHELFYGEVKQSFKKESQSPDQLVTLQKDIKVDGYQ